MDLATHGEIGRLSTDILVWIIKLFLTVEDEDNFALVCRAWRELRESEALWGGAKLGQEFSNSCLSRRPFRFFGLKTTGTEGKCCKVQFRGDRKVYAMKKARVYPKGEGVPYYMLREIEFLRGLCHPNVSRLTAVAFSGAELFVFFPYCPRTLHEALNSPNEPAESGVELPIHVTKRFLYQILQGVCACHERGVLHRNIKPKHLLLYDNVNPSSSLYPRATNWKDDPEIDPNDLETCKVCLSDFALVRTSLQPLRRFTPEVVTLWYRAPEVLLGGQYFTAVDMWAVGCVFAEMLSGKPFFAGVCEINQLFEIFSKVGTPTEETWPGFNDLPNVEFEFPNWPRVGLGRFFPGIEAQALDLLEKILEVDPAKRISAREALSHPYFDAELVRAESPEYATEEPLQIISPSCHRTDQKNGLANPKLLSRYLPNIIKVERESLQNFYGNQSIPPCALEQEDRFRTVSRLIEVVESFDMSIRTEFLAITLMDRFLSKQRSLSSQHLLLGTTCLHIASKCEDVSYIGVMDLIHLQIGPVPEETQKLSTTLLELQEKVLNILEFQLAIPTVLDFIHGFCHSLNLDQLECFSKLFATCSYLAELSLLDNDFVSLLPSQVAVGVVAYASLLFEPLTNEQLQELIFKRAASTVEAFWESVKKVAIAHEMHQDTSTRVLNRRYSERIGQVFHTKVDVEDFLANKWSFLVAKEETPFADSSLIL